MKLCIEGLEGTLEEVERDNDYLINENKTLVKKMKDFNSMVNEAEELVVRSQQQHEKEVEALDLKYTLDVKERDIKVDEIEKENEKLKKQVSKLEIELIESNQKID